MPVKGKRFTFYSGVLKGGSTTRLLTCTVTVFERWSDLTIHEIQVCRWCQLRLWRRKQLVPMVLAGSACGVVGLLGLPWLFLLPGVARFAVPALAALVALALGGVFAVYLWQFLAGKPKHAQLEPLVLAEAVGKLPK